jgi:hypothetical protein
MTGIAYVFCRSSGAAYLGHVGGAFELENGNFLCFGTENPTGHPLVKPDKKGFWTEICDESEVVGVFKRSRIIDGITCPPYDCFKSLTQQNPDCQAAVDKLNWCGAQPYVLVGAGKARTCEDDVCDTLSAYGLWMPWPYTFPAPNGWFGAINARLIPM